MFKVIFCRHSSAICGRCHAVFTRTQEGHATENPETAARLFNQKVFSEATIEGIITAAGLTHGGFYRHFNSKDELYAEAVRNFLHPDRSDRG
jgi:hypothetical protein